MQKAIGRRVCFSFACPKENQQSDTATFEAREVTELAGCSRRRSNPRRKMGLHSKEIQAAPLKDFLCFRRFHEAPQPLLSGSSPQGSRRARKLCSSSQITFDRHSPLP